MDWGKEPDLERLRRLHALLSNNPHDALPGLEELAQEGSAASTLYLADFYMGNHKDENKARFWYTKAHEQGVPQASYMLGRLRYKSHDYEGALEAFSKGAEKGYAPAIYRLAKMYQHGDGTAKNVFEYKRLLEEAWSKGHVFAKRDLAGLLLTGRFGVFSAARGALLLLGLWSDIALLTAKAVKPGSTFDERVLA